MKVVVSLVFIRLVVWDHSNTWSCFFQINYDCKNISLENRLYSFTNFFKYLNLAESNKSTIEQKNNLI